MSRVEFSDREFELSVPLVIIGGGAAGLVAALSAKAEGIDPLVLERDAVPRGSTALSAGLIPAPGTRWQRAAGVIDTPETFAADILHKADDEPDPNLVRLVTKTIGPTLEWLAEAHGLPFSLVDNFRYPGHSELRMHGLPSRSGEELIDRLRTACEQAGIDILTDAHVDTLIASAGGEIRGIVVERPDGSREEIGCDALILACNGYGGNPALVAEHIPSMREATYFGHPGNQGDALIWGEALDAATRHLGGHQGHGSVAHPVGILISWATVMEGGFQVNAEGRRFSNEAKGYSEQAANVLTQPDGIAWTVFDARIADIARQFEDFRQAEQAKAIVAADTIEELAAKMQVDPAALSSTFNDVEEGKSLGRSDPFGRNFASVPRLIAPYRAVKVTGALFHTQGGLATDGQARVVRQDGSAIENLFAAGGAACGVSGSGASGYLSGNGLLTAVALGRVSGLSAANMLHGA
ncbi:fumarate reductase flavoprotein subunit [Rhizobium sp. NFR07]|uniref:FAD-dependent oxidoreductase n=1 Tax=Rhizobium sp. NFR07 TaxID=1566262 RepID=UPI0008EC5C5F|nr:FAD-dependent oxidoreductase [Rhizobium sp. NFR07]SFB16388.1 fumarate reductase flavoprotein subunit [Rhizobium sp. NFR07]